jgi:hypothetical protein
MTITFGTAPTGPPPSTDEPWLWIGDQWVLVATDTSDDVPPTLDELDEAKAEAAMSDVTIPRAVPLKDLPDVELVAVGQWPARTGPITVTGDDLRQALAATQCPAVGNPVLKLGHDEPEPVDGVRWDGAPAVGWVSNLRLSDNKAKLLGDYRGVPGWLADVMPSAYPRRSVEIKKGWQCQIGHTHPFVITGVALLGVQPPAVGVIRSLHDVQALYTMAAAGGEPPPEVVRSIEITLGAGAAAAEPERAPVAVRVGGRVVFGTVQLRRVGFNPAEKRDRRGRWTEGGPGVGVGDLLKPGSRGVGGGGSDGEGGDKLSPAYYDARAAKIEDKIGEALKSGQSTDVKYGVDVDKGVWDADRARIHKEIVNDLYERKGRNVPNEGKAVIAGGLGGAGKSTVLKGPAKLDTRKYLTLNPDDVKEEMAARGLIPKIPDLSPMEVSALAHEESSHITNLLAKRAYAERKNVIWDITMASKGSVQRRINELRQSGYDDLSAVFVDIPVETSVERALARWRRGVDEYNGDKGYGGRYVPPSIIRKNVSNTRSSANREVFDDLRFQFDTWSLYDNSGTAPKRVDQGRARPTRLGKLTDTLRNFRGDITDVVRNLPADTRGSVRDVRRDVGDAIRNLPRDLVDTVRDTLPRK